MVMVMVMGMVMGMVTVTVMVTVMVTHRGEVGSGFVGWCRVATTSRTSKLYVGCMRCRYGMVWYGALWAGERTISDRGGSDQHYAPCAGSTTA